MESVEYGFYPGNKIFNITFLDLNHRFDVTYKELLIQLLFNLCQQDKITVDAKEQILEYALLNKDFPELMNHVKPLDVLHKINFMFDFSTENLVNPTVEMVNKEGLMPHAYIVDQKRLGIFQIFPFFRFKDEGIVLAEYLFANGKISLDQCIVLKIQINRLKDLPNSYFESNIKKTLKPAPH